jgi:hypothetical protein
LFRLGARKLNASYLASTVDDTGILPSIPNCRTITSQRQPSAASLVTQITSQADALVRFSKVCSEQHSLSTCCNPHHRRGLFSLAFSSQPPSLLRPPYYTPTLQGNPDQACPVGALFSDLLHPQFPPSISQHTPLYDLLNPRPISLRGCRHRPLTELPLYMQSYDLLLLWCCRHSQSSFLLMVSLGVFYPLLP